MNRYVIEYYSRTLAALNNSKEHQTFNNSVWKYDYPNYKDCELNIYIKDRVVKHDNVFLHTGLSFFADIKIDSENEAKEVVKENVEQITNLISFSTLIYCAPAILVSIINIIPDFSPFTYYPQQTQEVINISPTKINKSIFEIVQKAYEANNEKSRIQRALTWLRKGIGEDLRADEFISYWIGIEVVKHLLLKEQLGNKKDRKLIRATKSILCKEKVENIHEWDRVKEIYENELHFSQFNRVKQNGRNGLLHGFKQLDNAFMEEIIRYIEPIRKTLIFCVASVLNLDSTTKNNLYNYVPKKNPDMKLILNTKLENLPNDISSIIQNPPKFDIGIVEKQYSINDDGKISMIVTTPHKFSCGNNVKFKGGEFQLWGNKDSGIEQAKIQKITVNDSKNLLENT